MGIVIKIWMLQYISPLPKGLNCFFKEDSSLQDPYAIIKHRQKNPEFVVIISFLCLDAKLPNRRQRCEDPCYLEKVKVGKNNMLRHTF